MFSFFGRWLCAAQKLRSVRTVCMRPVERGDVTISEEWRTLVKLLKGDPFYLGSVTVAFGAVSGCLGYSVREWNNVPMVLVRTGNFVPRIIIWMVD